MTTIRILLIDDEPIVLKGIHYIISHTKLEDVAIETSMCDGSLAADQLLNEQEFDIVFTDITMPGMDGLTFIEKWRDKMKNIQWVILSGYDDFRYAQKAILLGVKDYILKPATRKDVQETLVRLINKHQKLSDSFISINEQEEIITKLAEAVWTLNEDLVRSSISDWKELILSKEVEVNYLMNTLNNLLSNLIVRLNNRGSILLKDGPGLITGNDARIMLDHFQQMNLELVEDIRIQRKGQVLDPIEFAKDFILKNLANRINLDDVANKLGLNSAYFSHLFKKETGTTFVEYRNQLRMEKAKQLIDRGNMKITDVATSLGYEDLSYFTRSFKKYTGLSPSKYMSTLEIN